MTDSVFLNDLRNLADGKAAGNLGMHLYAGRGAKLWEKLADDELTYPISRANRQLVHASLSDIARCLPRNLTMVDLAPGGYESVISSTDIAKALGARCLRIKEGSMAFLKAGVEVARRHLPSSVEVVPLFGDVFAGDKGIDEPTIAYFGGGTISNLIHPMSQKFPMDVLKEVLEKLVSYAPCGWLLLSFDTTHDKNELFTRYGSNTYHDFIENIMYRAADEFPFLGLKPHKFSSTPSYVEESRQFGHILTAMGGQDSKLGYIEDGRQFHVTSSYKIAPEWFEAAVEALGYSVEYQNLDTYGNILYLVRSPYAPARGVTHLIQPAAETRQRQHRLH